MADNPVGEYRNPIRNVQPYHYRRTNPKTKHHSGTITFSFYFASDSLGSMDGLIVDHDNGHDKARNHVVITVDVKVNSDVEYRVKSGPFATERFGNGTTPSELFGIPCCGDTTILTEDRFRCSKLHSNLIRENNTLAMDNHHQQ